MSTMRMYVIRFVFRVYLGGGKPKTLAGTSFTIEARVCQYFIFQKMMPATHYSNVIVERAILIYAILTGMSIDVGRVLLIRSSTLLRISLVYFSLL